MTNPGQKNVQRKRLTVRGTVQGVGFRPFVYRLAHEERLGGFVQNDGNGVTIEVQGPTLAVRSFVNRLPLELPPPGLVTGVTVESLACEPNSGEFVVSTSTSARGRSLSLAPDGAVCKACLAEMADPDDRRYRYPFINCTHCGPRFTITSALPYDRPSTTMASFPMCSECKKEYEDPGDRRYHAQPVACPACGPRLWLEAGAAEHFTDWAVQAHGLLAAGQIVAIKGLGGFHLAVNAGDDHAVRRLRRKKLRPCKPLAVMVRNVEVARRMVELDDKAEDLLCSYESPIVVAPMRPNNGLSPAIAPGLTDLGIMLPYTPLHHLLFEGDIDSLVMTSANSPAEPIITDNAVAVRDLPADAYLLHDRRIEVACDDSVVRTNSLQPMLIRRARGYVPRAMDASHLPACRVLALGAQLKVTPTTLNNGEMVVGRHIGDLGNVLMEASFREEVQRLLRFAQLEPEVIAVDLHRDLFSVLYAEETFANLEMVRVQHHHAHLAAVLFEYRIDPAQEVAAIVLDGMGYGPDGTVWGGEVLVGSCQKYKRVGRLRPVPQPGGDKAAIEPRRMATSLLLEAKITNHPAFDQSYAQICHIRAVSPLCSSAGRLFDGVAAILGIAPNQQSFEGQAPALLEALVDTSCVDAYPLPIVGDELDTRVLVSALVEDKGAGLATRAARFHHGLADGLAALAIKQGKERVVLAGGSMINRVLSGRIAQTLGKVGLEVFLPQQLPPGDGGLSAGQAAVAACTCAAAR